MDAEPPLVSDEVSVCVLGPLRAFAATGEVGVPGTRRRALLAALALAGGRPVSVGELVDAVWEDDPPEGARPTLQTYVSRLRRVLGPSAICHGPAGYWLDGTVATDLAEARDGVGVLAAGRDQSPDERADLAVRVLSLWDGPALPEMEGRDWFRPALAEVAEMRANLVELAAEALLAAGRPVDAVSLIESEGASEGFRELSHALLVEALAASGRSREALRAADRYRRRLRDEAGLSPGPRLAAAEQAVLQAEAGETAPDPGTAADAGVVLRPREGRLARPTPLLGRDEELRVASEMVGTSRLVTLTGVGGIGKTRLAAELVDRVTVPPRWVVVELAPVPAGEVVAAVGTALGYRARTPGVDALAELLRTEELGLLLDNCEHVVAEARELARALLVACPGVRILATSRIRLDVPEERALQLAPLTTRGLHPPAVDLFVDRVRRAGAPVEVDSEDPRVAALCERLEGIPLALELAASRVAALGLAGVASHLSAALDVLDRPADGEGRHATLGNVVRWSIDLLDVEERRLLAALSTFQGELDLAAAEAVGGGLVDAPVPFLVGRLVDASLLRPGDEAGRSGMLDMVRRAGRAELEASGIAGRARDAHARWVASRAAEIDARSVGREEVQTTARIDDLRNEALAALAWVEEGGDVATAARIAGSLAGPLLYRPDPDLLRVVHRVADGWSQRGGVPGDGSGILLAAGARAAFLLGDLGAVDDLAGRALAVLPEDGTARPRVAHARGVVRLYQGRFSEAEECFAAVVSDAEAGVVDRLDALGGAALAAAYRGDLAAGADAISTHRALAEVVDSDTYRAFADFAEGELRLAAGDPDGGIELLRAATGRSWQVQALFVWGIASTALVGSLVGHGRHGEAGALLPDLLERWRRTATWPQLWTTLRLAAQVLVAAGSPDVALLVLAAADRDPAAPTVLGPDLDRIDAVRARAEAVLGGPAAAGIVAGAAAVDRVEVLERVVAALRSGAG